jgi:Leucine rich repeat/Leucine Rich repeat
MNLPLTRLRMFVMAASLMAGLAAPMVVTQATDRDLEAVRAIEEMGGRVERAIARAGMPVVRVELNGTKATDTTLAHLKKFPALEILDLRGTQVTDDGLIQLEGCKTLTHLDLDFTQITDAGLARMKGLTSLRWLSLTRTQVTDAGLAQLEGHKTLGGLVLDFTQVTDAGLAQIKRLPSLRQLSLGHTKITDTGLASLQGLTGLQHLDISRTQATDAGLLAIRQALPLARVEFNRMARGDPDGEREFITYLRGNGIVAERDLSGWSDSWRVIRPATKDYSVEFVLIFFPTEATAEQMHNELLRISLAMMLNAPAHLAMSYPNYRAPKVPDSGWPNAEQDPTCNRIKDLFNHYKRGSAKSREDVR